MSRDLITNPKNSSNSYMLAWTGSTFSALRGIKTRSGELTPLAYSYGGSILRQIRPVRYSGTTVQLYGTTGLQRDTAHFIGSTTNWISGSLADTLSNPTNQTAFTASIASSILSTYLLFGDITTSKTSTVNGTTTTGASFTAGDADKTLLLQLSTGTERATHYSQIHTLDTSVPIVGTGYISAGTTGYNDPLSYYK